MSVTVIGVILFLISPRAETFVLYLLFLMWLLLAAMSAFFLRCLCLIVTAKRVKVRFTAAQKREGSQFKRAYYTDGIIEYENAFPYEKTLGKLIYKKDKEKIIFAVKNKNPQASGKNVAYDKISLLTVVLGLVLSLVSAILIAVDFAVTM